VYNHKVFIVAIIVTFDLKLISPVQFVIMFTVHVNTKFSTPSSVVMLLIVIEEKSKILA